MDALGHLEYLGMDVNVVVLRLLQDGLAHALPFRAFCRVVGSFLSEGSEVIVRYGLAALKLRTPAIVACSTAAEVEELLFGNAATLGDTPESSDCLTKTAFSFSISNDDFSRESSRWVAPDYLKTDDDKKHRHIFCRPRLFEPRGLCPDEVWEAVWSWVPETCRIFDPRLVYSPSEHGTSLRTCLEISKNHAESPMIFFLYTPNGDILGGFSPTSWIRTTGYVDLLSLPRVADDAFVFRKLKAEEKTDIFPWSGGNRYLFQASEIHGLVFGGNDPAITVHKDLQRASTGASQTFGSPSLLGSRDEGRSDTAGAAHDSLTDFEIARFEVFALS